MRDGAAAAGIGILAIVSEEAGAAARVVQAGDDIRIRPMRGRVVLKERHQQRETLSGLILPGSPERDGTRVARGTVVAVGPPTRGEPSVSVGDDVLFDRHGEGLEYVRIGGAKLHVAKADTLLGVLEP